ncbi:MAG: hypothetical protein WBG57_14485, partial [Ornithinimicrobium sp.]
VLHRTSAPEVISAAQSGCPDCGTPADSQLRFCSKCARPRGSSGQIVVASPAAPPSWWQRLLHSDDRAARRAYRRSLPPFYRWRRAGIVIACVIALSFAFAIVGTNPAAWAQQRWYDAMGSLVQVRGSSAEAVPQGSEVEGFPAAALVDDDSGTAWATAWQDPSTDVLCGQAPGGRVKVSFPSTRLKQVRVLPPESGASLQQRPASVDLTLPDGTCQRLPVTDEDGEQRLDFDSLKPVTSVVVSVAQIHPSDDERTIDEVALAKLALFSRP